MKTKKGFDPYKVVLDDEEKEIERAIERGEYKKSKKTKEKIAVLKEAASNYLRKDAKINIRLSSSDLLRIKEFAAYEGLSYQTLISSVLHKFAAGHLGS